MITGWSRRAATRDAGSAEAPKASSGGGAVPGGHGPARFQEIGGHGGTHQPQPDKAGFLPSLCMLPHSVVVSFS